MVLTGTAFTRRIWTRVIGVATIAMALGSQLEWTGSLFGWGFLHHDGQVLREVLRAIEVEIVHPFPHPSDLVLFLNMCMIV